MSQYDEYNDAYGDNPQARRKGMGPVGDVVVKVKTRTQREPFEGARPEIDDLAAETGEHANLMIEEHGLEVFLCKARGDKRIQLDTHAGMRVPL